jgi:hypothetical protein
LGLECDLLVAHIESCPSSTTADGFTELAAAWRLRTRDADVALHPVRFVHGPHWLGITVPGHSYAARSWIW